MTDPPGAAAGVGTGNVIEVAPLAIDTVLGGVSADVLLVIPTLTAPPVAAALRVTVQKIVPPGITVEGEHINDLRDTDGLTVICAVLLTEPATPVIVATPVPTAEAVAVN